MDIQAHRKDEHVFIAEKLYQSESRNRLDEVWLLFKNIPEISKKRNFINNNHHGISS